MKARVRDLASIQDLGRGTLIYAGILCISAALLGLLFVPAVSTPCVAARGKSDLEFSRTVLGTSTNFS